MRRAYRGVVGPPVTDPLPGWRGTAAPDLEELRLLHVGDCSLRAMESSHDFYAPLGYPRYAADVLLERGIGIKFSHYFAVRFEHLPDMELLRRRMRFERDPDVIVVHTGATYARRVILPDTRTIMRLRCDLGRRLGRRVFSVYRPLRPVVRRVGRHAAVYPGPAPLERFVRDISREWPEARIALMQPFLGIYPYPTQIPIRERTAAHVSETAARCGVDELDYNDLLGTDPALRGANGYNLSARGSEIVGRELAEWILADEPPSSMRELTVGRPVRA